MQQLKEKALKRAQLSKEDILQAIEERACARREFDSSDQIRSDLSMKCIALMDIGKETAWGPCIPTHMKTVRHPIKNNPQHSLKQKSPAIPPQQEQLIATATMPSQ